jgi:hypothetical protein
VGKDDSSVNAEAHQAISAFLDCREAFGGFRFKNGKTCEDSLQFSLLRETFLRSLQSELHEDS